MIFLVKKNLDLKSNRKYSRDYFEKKKNFN